MTDPCRRAMIGILKRAQRETTELLKLYQGDADAERHLLQQSQDLADAAHKLESMPPTA